MKLHKLATLTVLSTTLLAGGAMGAFADEVEPETPPTPEVPSTEARQVTTDGQISFTSGTGDEDTVVIPPVPDPDVDITPEVPGSTGPLTIAKAATMKFGPQVISNQDQTYNMVAELQQKAGTTGDANKVPYVSFAQVQDTRGTNAGWDLSVRLSDFTSNSQNNILRGTTLSLLNPTIGYEGNTAANAPVAHAAQLTLVPGSASRPVMTAARGRGAGTSSVIWGNQSNLNAQYADENISVVTNDAIKLFVPGASEKDAATYTSTLTWDLAVLPVNEN